MLAAAVALGGCETKGLIDPGEMMRTTKVQLTVPVMSSIAQGLDEAEIEYASAVDVRQSDLKADQSDYIIGRNDLLSISITDVAGPGVESVKTSRVSESGNISLPLIGTVKATGLTDAELERAIAQVYRDKAIIQNAQVSVTVLEQRQRTFSILGAVGRPGQYQIVQSDFRMLDALTIAGDVQVQGIEYAYIVRKDTKPESTTKPVDPNTKPADPLRKPVDPLQGKQGRGTVLSKPAIAQTPASKQPVHLSLLQETPAKPAEGEAPRKVMIDGKWVDTPGSKTPAAAGTTVAPAVTTTTIETPATPAAVAPGTGTGGTTPTPAFEFDAPRPDSDTRVIRVPLARLQALELQYNVVIRANDTIIVPGPKVGEYYMGGHVQRTGVYSLTGRQITLKQAIISAGMIDPLGWPERTEVIRRIGKDRELFVRVNLPKIFAGEQPDFYLRPYDTVNVGTNILAPFLAAIRSSFRFTYGFGFIYDRNFYDQNNTQGN
jgi:protein involved in polysaccharide export with SLBB domain